jgi:hypothetical protein
MFFTSLTTPHPTPESLRKELCGDGSTTQELVLDLPGGLGTKGGMVESGDGFAGANILFFLSS